MARIDILSLLTGIVFTIGGLILLVVSYFFIVALIYAVFVLAIGIVILFTLRKQEEIEQIKDFVSKKVKGKK